MTFRKVSRRPAAWRVNGWDRPDLSHARSFIEHRSGDWPAYVPALALVPCGTAYKPALFLKVGRAEWHAWTHTVEPMLFRWRWHLAEGERPYVVLRLSVFLRDTAGTPIGLAGAGSITVATRQALDTYGHQLVCSTLFDPADPRHREAVTAWATVPGPSMVFLVEDSDDYRANYLSAAISLADRRPALTALADAERELSLRPEAVPGGFADAAASVRESLPAVIWWQ
jgi:hypothetical protein